MLHSDSLRADQSFLPSSTVFANSKSPLLCCFDMSLTSWMFSRTCPDQFAVCYLGSGELLTPALVPENLFISFSIGL